MADEEFSIVLTPDVQDIKHKDVRKRKIDNNIQFEENDDTPAKIQAKWHDPDDEPIVAPSFDCLDINKIKRDKAIKVKSFSALEKSQFLVEGFLNFFRCTDGNRDYPFKQGVTSVIYHKEPLLIAAGHEGTVACFQVDGEQNKLIGQPFFIGHYHIKGGRLLGDRVVFWSKFDALKVFDVQTSEFSHHRIRKGEVIKRVEVSPNGQFLAVSTKTSHIYIVSTITFAVIFRTFVSGVVRSLAFSHKGKYLYAYGAAGTVSVFQMDDDGRPIFLRRWLDRGYSDGSCIVISPNDELIACGSRSGIVNVYRLSDTWAVEEPVPLKEFKNICRRANLLQFNHSSELLAFGSSREMFGFKLAHLGSMTVFSNFPKPIGKSTPGCFSFSPNSKYFSVGLSNGKVACFDLKHFRRY